MSLGRCLLRYSSTASLTICAGFIRRCHCDSFSISTNSWDAFTYMALFKVSFLEFVFFLVAMIYILPIHNIFTINIFLQNVAEHEYLLLSVPSHMTTVSLGLCNYNLLISLYKSLFC